MIPALPKVSVIIPTYRHGDFIVRTLESVFAQTFRDYEIIVVNDGSPDATHELLRPYRDASLIRYILQANAGQAAARNRGLDEARGQFIAFLDDDDLWPSDKLNWQVEHLLGNPEVGAVFGRYEEFGANLQPERTVENRVYRWADFCGQHPILSPGQALFRRDILVDVGGFDSSIWGADDWDLYLRLAGKTGMQGVPQLSLYYRRHAGNASADLRRMRRNERKVLWRHLATRFAWRRWRRLRMDYSSYYSRALMTQGYPLLALYEACFHTLLDGCRSTRILFEAVRAARRQAWTKL